MVMTRIMLAAHGQGPARPSRREAIIATASRNFAAEVMNLDFLAAYGQRVERQFLGFSSAYMRWRRRLQRRYRWLKGKKGDKNPNNASE